MRTQSSDPPHSPWGLSVDPTPPPPHTTPPTVLTDPVRSQLQALGSFTDLSPLTDPGPNPESGPLTDPGPLSFQTLDPCHSVTGLHAYLGFVFRIEHELDHCICS